MPNDSATLIVIPTYNESETIPALLTKIANEQKNADILVIDDSSPDNTAAVVKKMQRHMPSLNLIVREKKAGLGGAYVEAFKWALAREYKTVIQMDADGSHDPLYLRRMIEESARAPIVAGSRFIRGADSKGQPLHRSILSRAAHHYVKILSGLPMTDPMGGFKCWRREALSSIDWDDVRSKGYFIQTELVYRAFRNGFAIKEIPIKFLRRSAGESKMSAGIIAEASLRMPWLALFR